jgi:L-iditol 2-dehydrogenase
MNATQLSTGQHVAAVPPAANLMRAGVYRGAGRVILESVPIPAIAEDELLVRVEASGICGTDVKKIHKGYVEPPQIFGHEIAGTIVAAGRAVRGWKNGQRVVCFHHVPCERCFFCQRKLFS